MDDDDDKINDRTNDRRNDLPSVMFGNRSVCWSVKLECEECTSSKKKLNINVSTYVHRSRLIRQQKNYLFVHAHVGLVLNTSVRNYRLSEYVARKSISF